VVQSVVDLAHGLGCHVTAEGVESQDIADWLRTIGCDQAQGYLWGRPAPWQSLLPRDPPEVLPAVAAAALTATPSRAPPSPSAPVVRTGGLMAIRRLDGCCSGWPACSPRWACSPP
jgi:hypothetical protein